MVPMRRALFLPILRGHGFYSGTRLYRRSRRKIVDRSCIPNRILRRRRKRFKFFFGPLCVHPDYQRKGIGSALIRKTRQIVQESEIPAITIYGDPHNYCTHGFKNGIDYNVSNMAGEFPLGLLVLETRDGFFGGKKWKAQQSDAFDFDRREAEEFDAQFEKKGAH